MKRIGVRITLLAGLTVVIAVGFASGDHAPARLVGLGVLSVFWVINAVGVVRQMRRPGGDHLMPADDRHPSDRGSSGLDAAVPARAAPREGANADVALPLSGSGREPSTRQRLTVAVFAAVVLGFSVFFVVLALRAGGPVSMFIIAAAGVAALGAAYLFVLSVRPRR